VTTLRCEIRKGRTHSFRAPHELDITRRHTLTVNNEIRQMNFSKPLVRFAALRAGLVCAGLCWLATPAAPAAPASAPPGIKSVRVIGTNVYVLASVPKGAKRVVLESRRQAGTGVWEPCAVVRLKRANASVTFRVHDSRPVAEWRVVASGPDPLPQKFYNGRQAFGALRVLPQIRSWPVLQSLPDVILGDSAVLGFTLFATSLNSVAALGAAAAPDPTRAVVESDIYKISGDTLYFFNQLRGLQIIDLSDPDGPVRRATLDLPAAGEEMYLFGRHVILLARPDCSSDESRIFIVDSVAVRPSIVATVSVPGAVTESRLVGSALYVATRTSRDPASTSNDVGTPGTLLTAIDLADPAAPVRRNALWYSGVGNVVMATDAFLFVTTPDPSDGGRSMIHAVDITASDGRMNAYGSLAAAGVVLDKFKMHYAAPVFGCVSEQRVGGLVTKLETFHLPDPRSAAPRGLAKLGELALAQGERLFATRFDGQRVYVVTAVVIDPLFVVDFSDPTRPQVAGEVKVPGWSTYIHPLGDRLVTVGVEASRVAVSLFDVQDPSRPALLSRLFPGGNHSWSEANLDERAFFVSQEHGLVLVPYEGYSADGYATRVQLIDLSADTLAARGVIEHALQPRRATVHRDRILSLSGRELFSVNATDRDHPAGRTALELAWPVNRVLLQGDYLLELSASGGGWNEAGPVLRVARADAPDEVLGRLALTNLPVAGATVRHGKLYVAQVTPSFSYPYRIGFAQPFLMLPPEANFLFSIVDLSGLPELRVAGQIAVAGSESGHGASLEAIWPNDHVLVWSGGRNNNAWWDGYPRWGVRLLPVQGAFDNTAVFWPYWGGGGAQLLAFDVSDATAPRFVSQVNLDAGNAGNYSKAFAAGGLVYLSYTASEYVSDLDASARLLSRPGAIGSAAGVSGLLERDFLSVTDYAEPGAPLVREPVNIPGQLIGVSPDGALLYTTGRHGMGEAEWLDASAYDSVAAYLVASVALGGGPRPVLVQGENAFVGRASAGGHKPSLLEHWRLAHDGKFLREGAVGLRAPANVLAGFADLLAVQDSANHVLLFDISKPHTPRGLAEHRPSGCSTPDLTRAVGVINRGLWIPLDDYGVTTISLDTQSANAAGINRR